MRLSSLAAPAVAAGVALALAGCPPASTGAPSGGDVLYVTAQSSSREPLALTVALPHPACVPPAHGGLVMDGTWTSSRPVQGLTSGTVAMRWGDGDPLTLDLQPMPADVAVQFEARRDYADAQGRWAGWWIERPDGVPDTVGTVEIRRLADGADCT